MDVIARLPDCDGQAADAVSAYTQIKMEDAPKLSEFRSASVQIYGHVFKTQMAKGTVKHCRPRGSARRKLVWTFRLQDYRKGKSKEFYWNLEWEKVPNCESLFVHREKGLFLSVYVDDIRMSGKKQNMVPCGRMSIWMNQRECEPNETIIEQYKEMCESRVSAAQLLN